ncbi:metallophosphoesterase family protein [Nocardioides dubius]|uniref:Calcineurin-like phosphoesterase domain-containing protein n=1 Tax=Nocardioides dubius TaxID=317019 RepID=A0ABN1U3L9_9ACTN
MQFNRRLALRITLYVVAWLATAVPAALLIFFNSSTTIAVASHDTDVSPTTDGWVTVQTGPYLPDLRYPTDSWVGVELTLGKTEATSAEETAQRYAFIASQPDAQVEIVTKAVQDLAWDAVIQGALLGTIPLLVWGLVGSRRRRELWGETTPRRIVVGVVAVALVGGLASVLTVRPWRPAERLQDDAGEWESLADFLPELTVPEAAAGVQVQVSATTTESKKLLLSAVDTYDRSQRFYSAALEAADLVELRQPEEDETVAVIVSDRHDNIGMDPVIRKVADRAGATAIIDAGDDTSTGEPWEAFSLDSLEREFHDFDRYAIQGNHDHGTFVQGYLEDRGWTTAQDGIFDGPGGLRMMARNDPRSSGLGTWRDAQEQTTADVDAEIAAEACAAEERVGLVLVHDDDMGASALEQGCVDLVVSGHVHVRIGPDAVRGSNGETGYSFTSGTSGGAAYAIAVGSKLRRPAQFAFLTIRDGRPAGIQSVTLETNGVFTVDDFVPLTYRDSGEI